MFYKSIIFLTFNLFIATYYCQNTTINQKEKTERDVSTKHKVMLIPFEPRLYLSEIDYFINADTKLSAKEIKYKFHAILKLI